MSGSINSKSNAADQHPSPIFVIVRMSLKEKIYRHYLQLATEKKDRLQQVLTDLAESGANETKRTAGDKHETALAMVQIEQAQKQEQLAEAKQQKAVMEKINPVNKANIVCLGSLINTDKGYFFVCTALPKAVVEGVTVMAVSPQSPLGQQLMGRQVGDTVTVNDRSFYINSID